MRDLGNGYIHVPRRGKPPLPPPGYEAVPGDKFAFRVILPVCVNRELVQPDRKCCGGASNYLKCKVINKSIARSTCVACQGDPEWIKNENSPAPRTG